MKKLITMFWSFFKIGAFTFGGGYAMVPLIEVEVVDKKKWIDKEEFLDTLVIAQSFPGALAVNTSIFIGYRIGGTIGAIMALLGTVLPSFFIIIFIASFFMQFRNNYYVDLAFKGISAAVPVLVLIAVVSLSKSIKKNYRNAILIIITIVLISFFKIHPVIVILASGIYGAIYYRERV
ncbi:chromate transporter [Clostridium tetani]|uniref:Chromate transporter n=1 Tax=Clostridium tetani TaxID=1513 RepID=A0A4Q0V941_CLOTA|nr:chromate transporter [Clostridium tetani]CDI48715.1 chromate transport protein [Clostridium tetani 12124569]KHO39885.1 chromate transporter [Clostridium tetani]RXI41768.1 chromate transporter [Clostridium tetani]RXI45348.1 chromate transporter [Clostridium tetani]RXI51900.1 chromate transporter [Clostridium tetani]